MPQLLEQADQAPHSLTMQWRGPPAYLGVEKSNNFYKTCMHLKRFQMNNNRILTGQVK
jgi:hypothetical protein